MNIFSKFFGDPNERVLKKVEPLVGEINGLERKFENFSNDDLKKESEVLKKRLKRGETLDEILPETFALVREASKRTLGQRHFDVQLIGGIVLHQGKITEMKTGEGKTLASTLPIYLNSLVGKGVHLVTVNDYLARRDTVWMGQIYDFLGLSVGCLNHEQAYLYDPGYEAKKSQTQNPNNQTNPKSQIPNKERDKERDAIGGFKIVEDFLRPCTRQEAYEADITYGTNNEFGFDYLRDNMAQDLSQVVQRKPYYAIIDEVDSILIDEARTPLIISAPDMESPKLYEQFARIVPRLKENVDYNIDEKMRAATLTEEGIRKIEEILGMDNIYEEKGIREVHHLEQALRAQVLFKRDKDYVVKDGEVIIVDEFTGRLMPGRRFSEGLHQALEAKEGVRVKEESKTLASITFQNYFRLYKKLAGMTGTAETSAEEFHKVYNLEVVVIPTNKLMIRDDFPDRVYKTEKGKFKAVVEEIKKRHRRGQPILVGTVSIEKNERLGAFLKKEGIPHQILNAKHHEKEAEIIAQAGKLGAVTIATNMAGRGVDIVLGGNPPDLREAERIRESGGLYVIGTERHEARRIDNQLRGRAGRQGDPGASRFFLSLEDDLMRIFGSTRIKNLMDALKVPEGEPIENKIISRAIESSQGRVEGYNFDLRRHILEYDDVANNQREVIYGRRRKILKSKNLKAKTESLIREEIKKIVDFHSQSPRIEEWNIEEICEAVNTIFPLSGEVRGEVSGITSKKLGLEKLEKKKQKMADYLFNLAKAIYKGKEKEVGKENMRRIEKIVNLRTIDVFWMEHLDNMEHLRQSVQLRAYGQRDPLVEYRNEAHRLFERLLRDIQSNITGTIFKVGLIAEKKESRALNLGPSISRKTAGKLRKVGRNDPCPCGARDKEGHPIKYKRCHGK